MVERLAVIPDALQHEPEEEMRLRELAVHRQRLPQHRLGAFHVAFLQTRTADVDPSVRVARLHLRDLQERGFGALEVALEQQADAVVVPALADRLVEERRGLLLGAARHDTERDFRRAITVVGMSGIRFMPPETLRRIPRVHVLRIVVRRGAGQVGLLRIAHAGIGELRVHPHELAVVHLGAQRDRADDVLRHVESIVHGVGRAGRNQPRVDDRARGPGIPLVDLVAVLVDEQAAVEVRAWLDRARAVVGHRAAVQDRLAVRVHGLELDPHVERVDRAAREEVSDLARADHDFEPDRFAGLDGRVHLAERRDDGGRRRDEGLAGAEIQRLFTDAERARGGDVGVLDRLARDRRDRAAHEPEDVHGDLTVLQELLDEAELLLVAVDEGIAVLAAANRCDRTTPFFAAGSLDGTFGMWQSAHVLDLGG